MLYEVITDHSLRGDFTRDRFDVATRTRAARGLGIDAEIIDVRTMVPLDVDTLV